MINDETAAGPCEKGSIVYSKGCQKGAKADGRYENPMTTHTNCAVRFSHSRIGAVRQNSDEMLAGRDEYDENDSIKMSSSHRTAVNKVHGNRIERNFFEAKNGADSRSNRFDEARAVERQHGLISKQACSAQFPSTATRATLKYRDDIGQARRVGHVRPDADDEWQTRRDQSNHNRTREVSFTNKPSVASICESPRVFTGQAGEKVKKSWHDTSNGDSTYTRRGFEGANRSNSKQMVENPVETLRLLETKEPNEVLMALSSSRSHLVKYFSYPTINDSRLIELLVKALRTACESNSTPRSLSQLLKVVNESGFLSTPGPVVHYLTSASSVKDAGRLVSVANALTDVLKALVHHLPSSSLLNVSIILAQLKALNNGDLSRSLVSTVRSIDEVAEMTEMAVKQIRGGDVVRDQEQEEPSGQEEPPDDFRRIPTYPSVSEIKSDELPFLRKNIVYGAYRDVDHYLDVQYRLLREDFICPLRDGLRTLQDYKQKNLPLSRLSDIRFYSQVHILTSYFTSRSVLYQVCFDASPFHRVKWESSKRLIYGSLVGLSKDEFENIIFGTVAARNPDDLKKGIVDICFQDENAHLLDLNPYTEYQMIECSSYFEAYRHVLEGLQEIQPGNMPFEQYILNQAKVATDVMAPRYIRGQNALYDFSQLVTGSSFEKRKWRNVPVLGLREWPSADLLGLDSSQYAALQTAVTKEFVTIQGPPGTGKTYIGLKIVQLLLTNKRYWSNGHSPILIVCYTNHALDQFLEGIADMCGLEAGQLVRVGGRCVSERLKECGLIEVKKRLNIRPSVHGQHAVYDVFERMNELREQLTSLVGQIQCARQSLIHELYLQQYMTESQAQSFFSRQYTGDGNGSLLFEWLQLFGAPSTANEDDDAEKVESVNNAAAADVELIEEDDEDEVRRIEEERQVGDPHLQSHNQKHLNDIYEAGKNCSMQVNLGDDEEDANQFQQVKNKKKNKHGKNIQNRLHSVRTMSRAEWSAVGNVWKLSLNDRWRLYSFWVSCLCEEKSVYIQHINVEYTRLTERLAELNSDEDCQALRQAVVIGMTTTGAAKNRRLLQRIQPKIVIVEEAAEVMESHIVTTLSPQCQQLILIGDHQQLRPNPTVYRLAKQYRLDISLFERMVKNDLHCDRLNIQHRMRPEIVKLIVPHIYKALKNHESVLSYENIRGINGNMFFVTHSKEERRVEDTKSRSNVHEAEFLAALCRYLMQQGYKTSQITVLTTYTGQMFLLRRMMPKSSFDGIRITPVDNFQGEENDIILLSLVRSNEEGKIGFLQIHNRVCVALSRARMGLFVIGNMELLTEASDLWNAISRGLKQHNQLVDALPLACQNHPETVINAKTAADFANAPEGGCLLDCGVRLNCGHVCDRKCHPTDRNHEEYKCMKPCVKVLQCNHACTKFCYEDCGKCNVLVEKTIPQCGHQQKIRCHIPESEFSCRAACEKKLDCGHQCPEKCGKPCLLECQVIIPDRLWPCGHLLSIACCFEPEDFPCTELVQKLLPCGHTVTVPCSENVTSSRCTEEVEYSRCGNDEHKYKTQCHMLSDDRNKICEKKVTVECKYNASHKFIAKCCDRETAQCVKLCNTTLPCGHQCRGQCGSCTGSGKHQVCRAPCRRRLSCNHQCSATCGESCRTCRERCRLHCGHRECTQPCNLPCDRCELACRWVCAHQRCELKCYQPCQRPPCNQPCTNLLPCGHRCIGLCGEPCVPLCQRCNFKMVDQLLNYLKVSRPSKTCKFLHLKPCGHVVEVTHMDEWVASSTQLPPYQPSGVICPICKQTVGLCPRYNERIKQYMLDVNKIRRASLTRNRLVANIDRAVELFWPDDRESMKLVLLASDGSSQGDLQFNAVSVGAVCVWQECWNLLQYCQQRYGIEKSLYDEHSSRLDDIKNNLIEAIGTTDMSLIVCKVALMEIIYLSLHIQRLSSFIQNPRLQSLSIALRSMCQRSLKRLDETVLSNRQYVNDELKRNFSFQQRDRIDDYIQYLEAYFNDDALAQLQYEKWFICAQGHAFGATLDDVNPACRRGQCGDEQEVIAADDGKNEKITIELLMSSILSTRKTTYESIGDLAASRSSLLTPARRNTARDLFAARRSQRRSDSIGRTPAWTPRSTTVLEVDRARLSPDFM